MLKILRDLLRYNREFLAGADPARHHPGDGRAVVRFALRRGDHVRRAAGHAAVARSLVRHHLARPGCVLGDDRRAAQHAGVRRAGRRHQPHDCAGGRTGVRLSRRQGRPGHHGVERHHRRAAAHSDPAAGLFRAAQPDVMGDPGGGRLAARLELRFAADPLGCAQPAPSGVHAACGVFGNAHARRS